MRPATLQLGRDAGGAEWAAELPDLAVDALVVLTQLGDTWLLFVVVVLFYLFGPSRTRGALAVATAIGAIALVVGLKAAFALPRPPTELHRYPIDGYGFPSGHAVGSTVVWGSLAVLADRWTRRARLLAAGVIVATVATTRVLLGVHYVGDVVAGVVVGAAFLAGSLWIANGDPTRAFAVAGLVALGAAAAGAGVDAAAAVGAATGAGLAWVGLDLEDRTPSLPVAGVGVVVLGSLWVVVIAVEPPWPVAFASNVVVAGGIVALPRLDDAVAAHLPQQGGYFSR